MGIVSAFAIIAGFSGIVLGALLVVAGFGAMGWWGLLWPAGILLWWLWKGRHLYSRARTAFDDWYDDQTMGD